MDSLVRLNHEIVRCRKCPRLVKYREAVAKNPPLRYRGQKYWAKPLPGFGNPNARIYIVGLAPAAHGGNRTGRMFTGDRSGDFLYSALFKNGLSSHSTVRFASDELQLFHTYIGAAVRCAPPDNKPTLQEFANCHPYLVREFVLLRNCRVLVALGSIAYTAIRKLLKPSLENFRFPKFGHGVRVELSQKRVILCSYHPSQQNTFTGKLTAEMFEEIFRKARQDAGLPDVIYRRER
jgi:uracil-DNA glycosylase